MNEQTHEDHESQPRKGPKQKTIPGAFENVKKHPAIERKMQELSDAMIAYQGAGKVCQDMRREIKTLMIDKGVPAYALDTLICEIDEGEPELKVRRVKPPKEDAA